jgi:hypothetical protein
MAAQQHESFEIEVEGLAEAKEWGGESFAPEVPPGEYLLAISSVARGTSKNGNATVIVDFEVADGEFAGKHLKNWYTLTETVFRRMFAAWDAADDFMFEVTSEKRLTMES